MAIPTQRRAIATLAICQALYVAAGSLFLTLNAIVGTRLANDPALSTVPHTLYYIVNALVVIPASLLMLRFGRRRGFLIGSAAGVASGLVAALAVALGSFVLFCIGVAMYGVGQAFWQYYRFAAGEVADAEYRTRAISIVIAGGIIGTFMGPVIIGAGGLLHADSYAAYYVVISLICLASLGVAASLQPFTPVSAKPGERAPLKALLSDRSVLAALTNSVAAYGVMVTIMLASPLAVVHAGHSLSDAALVIQWHLIGMYAPSLITGHLIHRFGDVAMMFAGILGLLVTAVIGSTGASFFHFWGALIVLGISWNFLFLTSTAILAAVPDPLQKATAQGANEFAVSCMNILSATVAGVMFAHAGWVAILLLLTLPLSAAASVVTLRYAAGKGRLWWSSA